VLTPVRASGDEALLSTTPVTADTIGALTRTEPEPEPLLVTAPVLPTAPVETVTASAVDESFWSTRSPVPVTPPDTSSVPAVLCTVVPPLLTASGPVTWRAAVALVWRTAVTAEPTPALSTVGAVPAPLLTISPVFDAGEPAMVMPPSSASATRCRSPVPDRPPETVRLPAVSVRVVPAARTVTAPDTTRAEVALSSVMPVTFEETGALMSTDPVPVPEATIPPA
jgi:hypothetical protein